MTAADGVVRRDPIVIVAADPDWADRFRRQRDVLAEVIGDLVVGPIEHIGSTAVPGLPAKPIIDMLARVRASPDVLPRQDALAARGWMLAPEPGDDEARRLSWCHPDPQHRTHHLHVVEQESSGWPEWLAFRDHLRTHPAVAHEYAELKIALAGADPRDRPRYRAAKAPFIRRVLEEIANEERGR